MHRPNLDNRIQQTTDPARKADLVKLQERIDATKIHLAELLGLKAALLDSAEARAATQRTIDALLDRVTDTSDAPAEPIVFVPADDLSQESTDGIDIDAALQREHACIALHQHRVINLEHLQEQRRIARQRELQRRRELAVCWRPEDEHAAVAVSDDDDRDQT